MATGTLNYLNEKYDNPLHLGVTQLTEILSYKNQGSLRNAISAETLPVKTFLLSGRRVAHIDDVVKYLDSQRESAA